MLPVIGQRRSKGVSDFVAIDLQLIAVWFTGSTIRSDEVELMPPNAWTVSSPADPTGRRTVADSLSVDGSP
jgi:hypothetical protein